MFILNFLFVREGHCPNYERQIDLNSLLIAFLTILFMKNFSIMSIQMSVQF